MESSDKLNSILKCKKEAAHVIQEILQFLSQYFWIYNGHMTRIFSENNSPFFNIPLEWHGALLDLSPEEMNEVPFGLNKEDWVLSFKVFVKSALRLGSLRFLQDCLVPNRVLPERKHPSSLLRGMSPKKLQEVEGMARRVASVCLQSGCSFVLDVGAGMGYLDQVLHYRYGLTVLGVDAAFSHGAQDRMQQTSISRDCCSANVTHVPFILQPTEESILELQKLLECFQIPKPCPCQTERLQQENRSWVLVALHACGDLTTSVLDFYRRCPAVKALVCLSCCYHKTTPGSFPLSTNLQECVRLESTRKMPYECVLNVYGLRLASQETRARWRVTTPELHSERAGHALYRASIEYALSKRGLQWQRPQRRLGKQSYANFQTYCDAALGAYDDSVKNEAILAYERFQVHHKLLERLSLLQVLLQPVLEVLILLDRTSYLKFDNDEGPVWLEAVTPEIVSPRNIAILAMKEVRVPVVA